MNEGAIEANLDTSATWDALGPLVETAGRGEAAILFGGTTRRLALVDTKVQGLVRDLATIVGEKVPTGTTDTGIREVELLLGLIEDKAVITHPIFELGPIRD